MDEWNETLAVALVVASCVLMVAVAYGWRRLSCAFPDLPLWRFLRRKGILPEDAANAVSRTMLQQGEIACTLCSSAEECRARLARGAEALPPANCPNRRLFDDFGIATDQERP